MIKAIGLVVLSACCCLAGCRSRPPAASADAAYGWTWYTFNESNAEAGKGDGVNASWGTWKKKLVYILLTDPGISETTTINASHRQTEYQVNLRLPKGQQRELRIDTADGETGRVAYGGQSYDLARGPVLVVLSKGEESELLQLKRNISDLPATIGSVVKLIRDDEEIARIFSEAR